MKKVAVFDIDGTLFRSSLVIEITNELIERGVFPRGVQEEFWQQKVRWLDRKGDYENYVNAVVRAFMGHVKGVSFEEFENAARTVVDRYEQRVYRYTRDLAAKLLREDYFLLAISHSPKGILDPFCERFGFHKVYGMWYELGPSDKFTGRVEDEHLIRNKGAILRRAVEKEHLTLEDSWGVGDTESDISFLDMVAHPVAFNPNQKLFRHAKRNHWPVVVERKDVVYEL